MPENRALAAAFPASCGPGACGWERRGAPDNAAVWVHASQHSRECGKIESWVYWILLLPQGERINSQTAEDPQTGPGTKLRNTKSFLPRTLVRQGKLVLRI